MLTKRINVKEREQNKIAGLKVRPKANWIPESEMLSNALKTREKKISIQLLADAK